MAHGRIYSYDLSTGGSGGNVLVANGNPITFYGYQIRETGGSTNLTALFLTGANISNQDWAPMAAGSMAGSTPGGTTDTGQQGTGIYGGGRTAPTDQAMGYTVAGNAETTTIASGSNATYLPQATISLASTSFIDSTVSAAVPGTLVVEVTGPGSSYTYLTQITYTGVGTGTITGCKGGSGELLTGAIVWCNYGPLYATTNNGAGVKGASFTAAASSSTAEIVGEVVLKSSPSIYGTGFPAHGLYLPYGLYAKLTGSVNIAGALWYS